MAQHHVPGRPEWRTSSYTNGGEACVEVAALPGVIAVRDSKDPGGPRLAFAARAWRDFAGRVREGDFDC